MQDYNLYRAEKNLSNNDMIRVIKDGFPAFSKVQMSFASNPQKSALCLVPEAEALLVAAYGEGEGLSSASKKASRPKAKPNRKKPHRLVVYLDGELFTDVQSLAAKRGYTTMQAFLENLISDEVSMHKAAEQIVNAGVSTGDLCEPSLLEGWE